MNITSARNVKEFVHILDKDGKDRPTLFNVPGHKGRLYEVTLMRDSSGLEAVCEEINRYDIPVASCKGNSHCVCYHVLAACLVAASEQGKELSWCESEQDAERLSNIEGKVFTVRSSQSGKVAYGVVRGSEVRIEFAPVGLSKEQLIDLAIKRTEDKRQWYVGERVDLTPDAYLKNDDHYVRLYRRGEGKYPKPTRLATVWKLDIGNIEAGWQRYTEARQAFDELYPDRDSALPAQRTRGRNKLFKT